MKVFVVIVSLLIVTLLMTGCAGKDEVIDPIEVTFDGLHHAAVQALAVNYVIGPAECDMLGLLTEEIAVKILDALIAAPTRAKLQKKIIERLDGLSSDDGPSADIPDTDQP